MYTHVRMYPHAGMRGRCRCKTVPRTSAISRSPCKSVTGRLSQPPAIRNAARFTPWPRSSSGHSSATRVTATRSPNVEMLLRATRSFPVSEHTPLSGSSRCDSVNSLADAATIECLVNRSLAYIKALGWRTIRLAGFVQSADVGPLSRVSGGMLTVNRRGVRQGPHQMLLTACGL